MKQESTQPKLTDKQIKAIEQAKMLLDDSDDESEKLVIPVIDLESSTSEDLLAALESTGFFSFKSFYLKQSLISADEMKELLEAGKRFFALPIEQKKPLFDASLYRGYQSLGAETLDPANQKKGDTKETFAFGRDVPAEQANKDKFAGPNIYPGEELGLDGWK